MLNRKLLLFEALLIFTFVFLILYFDINFKSLKSFRLREISQQNQAVSLDPSKFLEFFHKIFLEFYANQDESYFDPI